MKHRLHPISFEAALAHIKNGKHNQVFVRTNGNYIRVDRMTERNLKEWMQSEYHYEEEKED